MRLKQMQPGGQLSTAPEQQATRACDGSFNRPDNGRVKQKGCHQYDCYRQTGSGPSPKAEQGRTTSRTHRKPMASAGKAGQPSKRAKAFAAWSQSAPRGGAFDPQTQGYVWCCQGTSRGLLAAPAGPIWPIWLLQVTTPLLTVAGCRQPAAQGAHCRRASSACPSCLSGCLRPGQTDPNFQRSSGWCTRSAVTSPLWTYMMTVAAACRWGSSGGQEQCGEVTAYKMSGCRRARVTGCGSWTRLQAHTPDIAAMG